MNPQREVKITHCNLLKFRCDQMWHGLAETDDTRVHFCERCREPVYFCSSRAEFEQHAAKHRCVAFAPGQVPETITSNEPSLNILIGETDPEAVFFG